MHAVAGGASELDRHLGVRDLYDRFEGRRETNWGFALMEMLVDPVLSTWVPGWVVEQYERANPFFRRVLRRLGEQRMASNRRLLLKTRREMVRRHQAEVSRVGAEGEAGESSDEESAGAEAGGDSDPEAGVEDADELAARLRAAEED